MYKVYACSGHNPLQNKTLILETRHENIAISTAAFFASFEGYISGWAYASVLVLLKDEVISHCQVEFGVPQSLILGEK